MEITTLLHLPSKQDSSLQKYLLMCDLNLFEHGVTSADRPLTSG